jgi:TonB family protein
MAYSNDFATRSRPEGDPHQTLFQSLEFKESRHRSLWMSLCVHGGLLTVLLLIPLIFTDAIKLRYDDVVLLAPPPMPKPILEVTTYKPLPKPKPKLEKPLVAPPPVKPVVVQPPKPPEPPKVVEVKIPEVIERPKPVIRNTPRLEEAAPVPAAPRLEVRTGSFSSESPAKTATLPAAQVQTGGFGDPNGIKGTGKPGKVGNIASLGSFDLPAGPGVGNGTGGAHGVKGAVANAGFGSGTASGSPNGSGKGTVSNAGFGSGAASGSGNGGGTNRTVQQGGFGDAEAAKPEAPKKRADTAPQTPVEILFKPKPEYTDEARKLKLEGEVLVRVLFSAGGDVRVLDVVRGLGHGLDENALRAAQQIKFKPAQRDGQPVDSTATVRILFQLAY